MRTCFRVQLERFRWDASCSCVPGSSRVLRYGQHHEQRILASAQALFCCTCRTSGQFQDWAGELASTYSYGVQFSGVGRVQVQAEGGQSIAGPGFATQIAVFRRADG